MANTFGFSIDVQIPADATAKLEAAAAKALRVVASELDGRYQDAMNSKVWVWPRKSKRGQSIAASTLAETAKRYKKASYNTGSPRDINDSSDLASSGDMNISGLQAEWIWSVDYAAAVHDGAWVLPWQNEKASKVLLPARPWTTAVLFGHPHYSGAIYPFTDRLAQEIEKALT